MFDPPGRQIRGPVPHRVSDPFIMFLRRLPPGLPRSCSVGPPTVLPRCVLGTSPPKEQGAPREAPCGLALDERLEIIASRRSHAGRPASKIRGPSGKG